MITDNDQIEISLKVYISVGKLTGYILGVTASLALGYYVLSASYSPLLHWLSPYLGPDLAVVLGLMFLFMGDPLHWPILLATWIILGAIVGIGARKGRKAVGAAIATYYTVSGILGLAAISMFITTGGSSLFGLSSNGALQSLLSGSLAPPPGTNIYTILTEPIIGRFVSVLSIITGTLLPGSLSVNAAIAVPGSPLGGSTYAIVDKVLIIFIPSIIANFVIFLVVAGLVGRFLYRTMDPASGKKRKGGNRKPGAVTVISIIMVIIIASLIPMGFHSSQMHNSQPGVADAVRFMAVNSSSPLYVNGMPTGYIVGTPHDSAVSESNLSNFTGINYAAGVVGRYGDVYNVFGYIQKSNSTDLHGWPGIAENHSAIFTVVAFSQDLPRLVNAIEADSLFGLSSSYTSSTALGTQISRYLNLIPEVTIIEDFPGNASQTQSVASSESNAIASTMNASSVSQLISFTLPAHYISGVNLTTTLYIYGASVSLRTAESGSISSISQYIQDTGTYPIFTSGLRSGYLVPGATSSSVNASLLVEGYLNSQEVATLMSGSVGLKNVTSILGSSIFMAGGVFQRSSVFFSPPLSQNIAAATIFSSDSTVSFTSNTTLCGLSFAIPDGGNGTENITYRYYSYANIQGLPVSLTGNSSSAGAISRQNLDLADTYFQSNQTFPARLNIGISYHLINATDVEINTTVANQGSASLQSFSINEYGIVQSYPGLVRIVQGSTNMSWPVVGSGSTDYSYILYFKNPGSYVMPDPTISYTMDGSSFSYAYVDPTIQIPYPDVFSTINLVELNSAHLAASILHQPIIAAELFPGFYFFDLIPLALILIDIPIEYHWYRKIMERRRQVRQNP